ncbi:GGDEF domain-containing protein [Crenobacter intestini]|nr:GGDEF domain-containing protein [Crenobacter intestini]
MRLSDPMLCCPELDAVLAGGRLDVLLQPIFTLGNGRLLGYEALVRGPRGSLVESPLELFARAAHYGRLAELDALCRDSVLEAFAARVDDATLFLNMTPDGLMAWSANAEPVLARMAELALQPARVVIELTEFRPSAGYQELKAAIERLRAHGFRLALDDMGEGFSNLRLWSELKPEFVKLDKHFAYRLHQEPFKEQVVRSMVELARASRAQLIAEGIETLHELRLLQRLGVGCGQGYLLGRPAPQPQEAGEGSMLFMPQQEEAPVVAGALCARTLCVGIDPLSPASPSEDAYQRFIADPELFAIPVVEHGQAVGILRRHAFLESFARPFNRELFGKKPCAALADRQPMCVDASLDLHELSARVAASGRNALIDGFVVTEHGRYLGVATGFDLIRKITELQISEARYANPLTGLPGNVPITEAVASRLQAMRDFVVAYADLDHFKPFNDLYGYSEGDRLICLLARLLVEVCDPQLDFVGHVGGDDFVVVMESGDWHARLSRLLPMFEREVRRCFSAEHVAAGGFRIAGRDGETRFFALTSVSVGVVECTVGRYASGDEVARAAACVKKAAKAVPGNSLWVGQAP